MNQDIINKIKENGVVGAGGAGFPTHVKVNAEAEYIVLNGAECEPLLRVDQQLLALNTKKILTALNKIREITKAKRAIIALKSKYKKAIKSIEKEIINFSGISVLELGNFYPAGDEQVLVYEATKRIVPEGGIPLNVGVIVLNVETILNIYNSMNSIPVTDKYITVTGEVDNPSTLKVPVGISIREVVSLVTSKELNNYCVINGGPMMGSIVNSLDEPVTKTTKGLIVLPKDHPLLKSFDKSINRMLKEARTACMHCSLCTEVCPRNLIGHGLKPDKLMRIASYASTCDEEAQSTTAFLCCDCRLCQYACVMDLQPWKLNKMLKDQFNKNNIKNNNSKRPEEVNRFREYKKYPVYKLVKQLGLNKYDVDAPMVKEGFDFEKVNILYKHHIGSPTVPIVKEGQQVKKGQKIGIIEDGKLGTNIHSSINGIIKSINDTGIIIAKNI